MNKSERLALYLLLLFFVILMLGTAFPDSGCNAGPSAPAIVRLWAATCDGGGR